jgi:hypothetical protein
MTRFRITIEHSSAGIRDLRHVLKSLLRQHEFKCVDAIEIPHTRNARRAHPRHNMKVKSMSNAVVKFTDNFDTTESDRLIRGDLLKFNEAKWNTDEGDKFLVVDMFAVVQRWENNKPIETITARPLPDVDELNASVPKDEWEHAINGPKPPYQHQRGLYLVRPSDGAVYTYVTGSIGGRIAIQNIASRIATTRKLRGTSGLLPLVSLGSKPMKTKYGTRARPDFVIEEWRLAGDATQPVEKAANIALKPPTVAEELNDEIMF